MAGVLAVAICVSAAGCRQSDVIQNLVYTDNAEQTNKTSEQNLKSGEKKDDAAALKKSEDGKDNDGTSQKKGGSDSDATTASSGSTDTGKKAEKDASADADGTGGTSSKSEADGGSASGSEVSAAGSLNGSGSQAAKVGSSGNSNDENGGSTKGNNKGSLSADDANAMEINDASGEKTYIPKDVKKVAAPGNAALIVQMLGGKGILCASSSSFLDSSLTDKVFSDELTGSPDTLWEDDSPTKMGDSDFKKLVADHPDCVVLMEENTFTEEQKATLKKDSIGVVILPALSTTSDIKEAVSIVGQMLKNDGSTVDSVKLATAYGNYLDGLVSEVEKKGNGYYSPEGYSFNVESAKEWYKNLASAASGRFTFYVDDWDQDGYFRVDTTGTGEAVIRQDGLALARYGFSGTPFSYFLTVGGVYNTLADEELDYKGDYYAIPFHYLNVADYPKKTAKGSVTSKPGAAYFTWFMNSAQFNPGKYLGDKEFPAVIVKNAEIKKEMEASEESGTGLYRKGIQYHSGFTSTSGRDSYVLLPKSLWETETVASYTNYISDDYGIYVNPDGVGSWTDGSVESVLEAAWASYVFYPDGYYTLDKVENKVSEFYQKFYRYDVTDSDLKSILMLDENG